MTAGIVGGILPFLLGSLAAGQVPAACKGPAELDRAIQAKPSVAAYDALGAWFGERHQIGCAVGAFESAVRMDPRSWEAQYNLALALLQQHKSSQAAEHLILAVRAKPELLPAHNALGTVLLDAGNLSDAEREFREVLKLDAKNVYALDHLAQLLSSEHRYVAAISYWNQALAIQPSDAGLEIAMAVAHSQNGDPKKAIEILKELIKAQPSVALAHFNLATIYAHQSQFREAAEEYQEALRRDPKDDTSRLSLVKALTTIGLYSDALEPAQEYAKHHPEDYAGRYLLGAVYRGLGDLEKAEPELKRAASMKPDDSEVQYNLGFVLAKRGKPQEALPHLEKALQLKPDSSEARFQLMGVLRALHQDERAHAIQEQFQKQKQQDVSNKVVELEGIKANSLLESGDAREAAERYRKMLQMEPGDEHTWYNLALSLEKLGDRKGERDALDRAVTLDSRMAPAHNQLAVLDLGEDRFADAERHLQAALAIDPQFAEAQGNLGVIYDRQGKIKEAESLFRQAVENDPQYRQGYLNLGVVLAQQNRLAEARDTLEKARTLAPQDTQILTALGMVQGRLGNGPAAIASFRKVIALAPASAEAHLNLGIALADNYDLDGALREFTETGRLAPDATAVHYNKGRVLMDQRHYEESRLELEAACRAAPAYAPAHYVLAVVEKNLGHSQEAVSVLRTVVKLEPQNADAYYLLGRTLQDTGNNREAVEAWKKAITIDPDQTQALFNLLRVLRETDPGQAKQYEARFVALKEKQQLTTEAETLNNFALASAKALDWPQAIKQLQEAIRICGDCRSNADLHKNLGLISCQSGDLETGEKELRLALALKPDAHDIEEALAIAASARAAKSSDHSKAGGKGERSSP